MQESQNKKIKEAPDTGEHVEGECINNSSKEIETIAKDDIRKINAEDINMEMVQDSTKRNTFRNVKE